MPNEVVLGTDSLIKVFQTLPPILEKKYSRQLVTKVTGKVRTDARKNAPSGKRTGTTEQKSSSARGKHLPLRRNIRSLKTRSRNGVVSNRVIGPPQIGPLVSGHRLVAWGRNTGGTVRPSREFMQEARDKNESVFNSEGAQMVRTFIEKDAKRLGDKQSRGVLTKGGAKRLAAIRTAEVNRQILGG